MVSIEQTRNCIDTVSNFRNDNYNRKVMDLSRKTDLSKEIIAEKSLKYPKIRKFFRGDTEITEVKIETPREKALFGKPAGVYITVEADCLRLPYADFSAEAEALAAEIEKMLCGAKSVLFVGVGNFAVTADSLGPAAAALLPSGEYKDRKISVFVPGAAAQIGAEPALLVRSAVEALSPQAVILADSLASAELFHIGKTVQLTDAGIAPGSGLGNSRKALTAKTLGVKTLAIGIPTVTVLTENSKTAVTPSNIDFLVNRGAKLIATAVALAVLPELDFNTVRDMMG